MAELAAKHYGLKILDSGIEDDSNNTRFLLLRTRPVRLPPGIDAKTSIVFSMKENVAGALFKALSVFALRDIDLSKIESRPCKPNLLDDLRNSAVALKSGKSTNQASSPQNALWMSPRKPSARRHETSQGGAMSDLPDHTSDAPASPILRAVSRNCRHQSLQVLVLCGSWHPWTTQTRPMRSVIWEITSFSRSWVLSLQRCFGGPGVGEK